MSSQLEQLDRAAAFATCQILGQGGSALIGAGAWSMAAGGAGMVPLTLGALSLFASAYSGCWDTTAAPTVPIGGVGSQGRCIEVDGCGTPWRLDPTNGWVCAANCAPVLSRFNATLIGDNPDTPGESLFQVDETFCVDGTSQTRTTSFPKGSGFELRPEPGVSCVDTAPGGQPQYDPIPYTDPTTGCELIIDFEGWTVLPGDQAAPVYKISASPSARATGGVITNCNFDPVIYMPPPGGGGGGGGPVAGPWDPSWDDYDPSGGGKPPWADFLEGVLGGILGDMISDAIQGAFQELVPQYRYTMRAACDYKQDGSFEDYTITLPEEPWVTRVLAMQEMQLDFLQQHLLWKTPTCGGGGQPVTGDPVTINWISDEVSPASGTRLNKRFVYFDQNNTPLQTTVDHWKDFVWQAGPVMVGCSGTPLGKPQVWAANEAEGKRVLEHAAQIAGVDLSNAEYAIGTSKSSRYGVPGTMRVLKRKGILGITSRLGPDGYPEGLPG